MSATLEPKASYHSDFQQLFIDIDGKGCLHIEIDGKHDLGEYSFQIGMLAIEPDDLEQFGSDLVSLAKEMREVKERNSGHAKERKDKV